MTINLPSLDTPPAGAIRFNSDSMKLEVYRGGIGIGTTGQTGGWWQIDNASVGIGTSSISGSSGGSGTRGVFAGGYNGGNLSTIDYINISSTGNAISFGTLSAARAFAASCASSTRGLVGGGIDGPSAATNTISFITISSTGNASSFGNLTQALNYGTAVASSTRGIFVIGSNPASTNALEYVTIASTGTSVDFGDTTEGRAESGSCASSTRGVFLGGRSNTPSPGTLFNIIDYITISTLGNAADFGDLINLKEQGGSCSNSIRGLYAGKENPAVSNVIEHITIASNGNATDFGDLTQARNQLCGVASPTRAVWGGGISGSVVNTIDYVTIMSTGNAIDFGDLTVAKRRLPSSGISNGHGGL